MTEAEPQAGAPSAAATLHAGPAPSPRRRLPLLGALAMAAVAVLLFALYGPPLMDDTRPAASRSTAALAAVLSDGSTARGREAWLIKGCAVCHGPQAEGGPFPGAPRAPAQGMPPFTPEQLPDAAIGDLCAWLASLR